jgi:hypothetical protein
MKSVPPHVRLHRLFGVFAVVHAVLLFVIFFPSVRDDWPPWMYRVWVGLATLWFLWPLALALHPAQSPRRVLVPLAIAAPFVFFWFRLYSSLYAPSVFGFPEGVELTPRSMFQYAASFGHGWFDGRKTLKTGRLTLEAYGPPLGVATPGTPRFSEETLKQRGIEIKFVASDVVSAPIIAHATGYNVAMMTEIKRRWPAMIKAAQDEDARWEQSYYDGKKAGRGEAKRDLRAGHLAIEVSDPPKPSDADFEKMLQERYHIAFRRVDPNADPKMANHVFGQRDGYNEVAEAEIVRRFGKATVHSIWDSFYESRYK